MQERMYQLGLGGDTAESALIRTLEGRRLYHAAPLHCLPSILTHDALIASRFGSAFGIRPRSSAKRRDRMLGGDEFVHLALDRSTPLLRDKLARGMPHVALVFDAGRLAQTHEVAAQVANAKAWRSKSALYALTDPQDVARLLRRRDEFGRGEGLEILVRRQLSLGSLEEIVVFSDADFALARRFLCAAFPDRVDRLRLKLMPGYAPAGGETAAYIESCLRARRLVPQPEIAFD